MNLLETIKDIDAKMESRRREVEALSQALMFLVDDLIDRDLSLCVDGDSMSKAVQLLKERGLMDYTRNDSYENVQSGLCDRSVRLKQVVGTITGIG